MVDIRWVTGGLDYPIMASKAQNPEDAIAFELLELGHNQGLESPNIHYLYPNRVPLKGGFVKISGVAFNHDELTVRINDKEVFVNEFHDELLNVTVPPQAELGFADTYYVTVHQPDPNGDGELVSNRVIVSYLDENT